MHDPQYSRRAVVGLGSMVAMSTIIDPAFAREKDPTLMTAPLIVFDVNETLLDIDVLDPLFERVFAAKGRMREWFAQLILYSQTLSLTGDYVPFGKLGAGVLRMLGKIHDVPITEDHIRELSTMIGNLPVHRDVPMALRRLKDAGCRLVTLTNTPAGAAPDPLDKAGLAPLLERRFTVEPARRFKPSPATYQLVTDTMDVAKSSIWLVAAHTWDTIGAQSFGWNAALVTRVINAPLLVESVPQPSIVEETMTEVVNMILKATRLK